MEGRGNWVFDILVLWQLEDVKNRFYSVVHLNNTLTISVCQNNNCIDQMILSSELIAAIDRRIIIEERIRYCIDSVRVKGPQLVRA